jgi:hypothetical protein
MDRDKLSSLDRRRFLQLSVAASAAGDGLLSVAEATGEKASKTERRVRRNERPSMTYRRLGRTDFMCSRLIFGCGAALMGGKAVGLLEYAFEAGVNYFDTGRPYRDSESQLAPFLKAHRDGVWITSKAAHMGWPSPRITPDQGKEAARLYTEQLEESLRELKTDYIDCYMIMGIDQVGFVRNEELYGAFLKAKQAGKVGYYGLSTHKNAQEILEAAIEIGWYDIVMPAVTPAGWYDYATRKLAKNTGSLTQLEPVLKRAHAAGIGLIAMKVGVMLREDPAVFDPFYSQVLKQAELSAYQRAYAYVLEHGFDAANSHMPDFEILQANLKVVIPK